MENKIDTQKHVFKEPVFHEDGKEQLEYAEQKLSDWIQPVTIQEFDDSRDAECVENICEIRFKITMSQSLSICSLLDLELESSFIVEMDTSKPNVDFIVSLFETAIDKIMQYHAEITVGTFLEKYPLEYPTEKIKEFKAKLLLSKN